MKAFLRLLVGAVLLTAVLITIDTVPMSAQTARGYGTPPGAFERAAEVGYEEWPFNGLHQASDGAAGDWFGYDVALDGDTAVVGAYRARVNGDAGRGAAYIFVRRGDRWVEQHKLIASDGFSWNLFGYAVALEGDTALISAIGLNDGIDAGVVYVFTRSGDTWSEQQKLQAGGVYNYDLFGVSVALEGDTAVIGASGTLVDWNFQQGAAYVYTRSDGVWSEQAMLTAADGTEYDEFGRYLDVHGDMIIAGNPEATVGGNSWQGAAYIFERSGDTWTQQQKLVAADGGPDYFFGSDVAVDGNTVMVGSRYDATGDDEGRGAVYVYAHEGGTWRLTQKLMYAGRKLNDSFGDAVALDGDTAVIGAAQTSIGENDSQGAAFVFTRDGDVWSQGQQLVAYDGVEHDYFGSKIDVSGNFVLVGLFAPDRNGQEEQGRIYFFRRQPLPPQAYFAVVPVE